MVAAWVRRSAISAIAAMVLCAAPAAAAAPPAADWTVELRKLVQLDPARGERMALDIEARARLQPASAERQLIILTAQFFRAEALLQLNQTETAAPLVEQALREVPASAPGDKLKGQLLMVRAGILSGKGKAAGALNDFQAAYRLFGKVEAPRNAAVALMGIGSIYQDAGDFERVLYYYRLADEAYSGDTLLGLSSANNQANALASLKRYQDAEASYRRALAYARQQKSPVLEARILNNIAAMQVDQRRLDAAEATIAAGLAITARDTGAAEWSALLLATKAQIALARDRPADAVALIEQAFAGKTADMLADQSYREPHRIAYEAYTRTGRSAKALAHLVMFHKLDEEGRALVTETNAALLSARFDFVNQNSRIATLKTGQLQRDVALAKLKARQNAIVLGSLLAVAVIVAAGLALYLRSLRRSRDAVRAANTALTEVNTKLSHALSAKSRFLATTSHEIRTPLNGVLGMAQVLLAEPALTPDVRQRLTLLEDAGQTMRRLVDDILEYARIDAGSVEVEKSCFDVHALLDESVQFWHAQADNLGLTITLEMATVPRYIFEDARRLRQIIYNLLANALKFTPAGGVSVHAAVTAGSTGETLSIAVTDTGIGIAADSFGAIFEMFSQVDTSTTRRFGGSGLGLAISLNLARALGGDLVVASTLGEGSTFTLALPLVRGIVPVEAPALAQGAAASELSHANVMMVGGSPIAQRVVGSLISERVTTFAPVDTVDAACAMASWPATDLLVVDGSTIAPPEFAVLAERLRKSVPSARLLVLAAASAPDMPTEIYDGADAVLARPFTAAHLMQMLDSLFSIPDRVAGRARPDHAAGIMARIQS